MRQLRIEFPGAYYHVISHGNGFQWIYKFKKHVEIFKSVLIDCIIKYQVRVHAVVLMQNHYHLLIETLLGNLSKFMRKLNHDFALFFNNTLKRNGNVFKERYKSILIEKENYYLNVFRYICQNPVRINTCDRCEDYKGSFLYWIKDNDFKKYIYLDDIKSYFINSPDWKNNFLIWVNEKKEDNPFEQSQYKYLLGSKTWIKNIIEKINDKGESPYYEKKKYMDLMLDEDKLIYLTENYNQYKKLSILIYIYSKYSSKTLKEISELLKIKNEYAVFQRMYRYKKELNKNKNELRLIKEIEQKVLNSNVKVGI